MKKLILLSALLFSFQFGKAQTYVPFVEDSMIVVNSVPGFGITQHFIYKYIGDTIINSLVYKRVYENSDKNDSTFILNSNLIYFGAIRENSKKVYFVFKDSANEKKIYDLSMGIGDSTMVFYRVVNKYLMTYFFGNNPVYCDSNGLQFLHVDTFMNTPNFVNGFGYQGLFSDLENVESYRTCVYRKSKPYKYNPRNYCRGTVNSYKYCFNEMSLSLKENNIHEVLKLYPNPSNDKITIENTNNKQLNKIKIFAINGQLRKQISFYGQKNKETLSVKELPAGIYFIQVFTGANLVTLKFVKE